MKLTEHFTKEELTRTDIKEFKELNISLAPKDKLLKLAEFAEKVRSILNCPMTITSGYRCEKLNKAVGGSPTSQHFYCEAIDFIPMKMSAFEAFARIIISNIEYGQCILEHRGQGYIIHISIGSKRQKMYSAEVGKYTNVI